MDVGAAASSKTSHHKMSRAWGGMLMSCPGMLEIFGGQGQLCHFLPGFSTLDVKDYGQVSQSAYLVVCRVSSTC